jgi:hypothetical protein
MSSPTSWPILAQPPDRDRLGIPFTCWMMPIQQLHGIGRPMRDILGDLLGDSCKTFGATCSTTPARPMALVPEPRDRSKTRKGKIKGVTLHWF